MRNTKIAVVGTGYVGTSNAVLLAQNNEVILLDVVQEKVQMINNGISPIEDDLITEKLQSGELNLMATMSKNTAYTDAEFIIIAVPTDYNPQTKYFLPSNIFFKNTLYLSKLQLFLYQQDDKSIS
jgi:UDPglucose 6-dehydrogenase